MRAKQIFTIFYGVMAFAVGLWRHLQTGDSIQAVWFGLVMGALAIIGALLLSLKHRLPGYLLIAISLAFVGGWFFRRLISGNPDGTSIRVILIICICIINVFILLYGRPETQPASDSA